MVPKMIVHIRDQNVEDHPPVEFHSIRFRECTVLGQHIDQLRVATAVAVLQSHHRQCRQKGYPRVPIPVETPRQQHALAGYPHQFVFGRTNASVGRQPQRHRFPNFDAVVVGFPRKFRDGQPAEPVRHRDLGARTAEGRPGGEDRPQVLLGFLVPSDSFGDL